MGYLVYGGQEFEFEDRLLMHLKFVIGQRLKKQESFFMSWQRGASDGAGRVSLWMSPYATLAFSFSGSREPAYNPHWLKALLAISHTPRGLVVISEEEAETYVKKNPDLM
ncbi:hypothetical protein NS354_08980 [Leucobacter chromiiresistens]|uniref:DUF7882 domain-containing protein n=2 Tax=Leucobacter chromiiresistens TaxID=1079994 RepID=A0A147EMD3_9MICO|nr:hypothetical protein NS354_08980 [Leucobacter chromiiresistens]